MTANHYIPIGADLYQDLLVFLRERQTAPLVSERQRAADLVGQLAQAGTLACEYKSQVELLGAELLESINYATGRQIETQLTPATVGLAKVALSETVPALGANVIPLPRTPSRDAQTNIEAAANRAVADMPPPLAAIIICEGRVIGDPIPRWTEPQIGSSMVVENRGAGTRLPLARRVRVLDVVHWVDGRTFEIHVGRADLFVRPEEVSDVG